MAVGGRQFWSEPKSCMSQDVASSWVPVQPVMSVMEYSQEGMQPVPLVPPASAVPRSEMEIPKAGVWAKVDVAIAARRMAMLVFWKCISAVLV